MMAKGKTGNAAHDDVVAAAQSAQQAVVAAAIAAGGTTVQATVKAADVTLYRAATSSAVANGVNPVMARLALKELGSWGF